MTSTGIKNQDYARAPVPDNATVGGYRIAVVTFGIGITLPVFFMGSTLSDALGATQMLLVSLFACVIVGSMMCVTGIVAANTRLSTYMLLMFSFGRLGAKIPNALLGITYVGFFAVTADIFGAALSDALNQIYGLELPRVACVVVASIAMTATAMFGYHWIQRFSEWVVPLLAIFMIYAVYVSLDDSRASDLMAIAGSKEMSVGEGITALIGALVLTAVANPDIARFAKNSREGLKVALGVVAGFPIVLLAGGIPTLVTGEVDIMKVMLGIGLALPALYILTFSTWTTNTINMYTSILTFATVFRRQSYRSLGIIAGVVGTALAALGSMDYFLEFAVFLGISTPPLCGLYVADYFIIRRGNFSVAEIDDDAAFNPAALIAWAIGAVSGWASTEEYFTLTTVPAVDGMLIASVCFVVLAKTPLYTLRPSEGQERLLPTESQVGEGR